MKYIPERFPRQHELKYNKACQCVYPPPSVPDVPLRQLQCVSVTGPDTRFKNTLVSEQVCISGRYSFETGFRIDHSCFWTLSKHMFLLSNSFGGITLPSLCFDKWFVVLTENSHGRNMWQPAAGEHSTLTTLPHNHRLSMLSIAAFDCSSSTDAPDTVPPLGIIRTSSVMVIV